MSVHVLDTSALYLLHNHHSPPLFRRLVDALVMAFADGHSDTGADVIVYTSDVDDFRVLRDEYFKRVKLERV